MEVKRYDQGKESIRNELLGSLLRAADPALSLQLWIAAATVSVGAAAYEELRSRGEQLGLAVLVLDADSAQTTLPGVPPIAALCATKPEMVLRVLEDPEWRDPKKPKPLDFESIRADLDALRALSGFDTFKEKLRKDLVELPTWPLLVRRQNRWLANQIRENPVVFFQVPYDRSRSVRRKVEDDMEAWFNGTAGSEPSLAAVVGERFDGKTWCVLDWLLERLDTLQIPVFFISLLNRATAA